MPSIKVKNDGPFDLGRGRSTRALKKGSIIDVSQEEADAGVERGDCTIVKEGSAKRTTKKGGAENKADKGGDENKSGKDEAPSD